MPPMLAAIAFCLATAAPVPGPNDVVATLHGRNILRKDAKDGNALAHVLLRDLLFSLARKEGIIASAKEVDAVLARGGSAEPTTQEQRRFITEIVVAAKVDQLLWKRYGGRVAMMMFGPVATEAQLRYLQDEEKKGTFTVLDPELAKQLWPAVACENQQTVTDPEEVRQLMTTAWYLTPDKK